MISNFESTADFPASNRWLFGRNVDLAVFLGSALASVLLLLVGARFGWLESATPVWTWVSAVLLIDVAHVWATSFRVYFDLAELKSRFWLYTLVPLGGYIFGIALYSQSAELFWRILAYIAVFHFIRQQFGWVVLYRAKMREINRLTFWIDAITVYLATIYPLAYWHSNPPRNFEWFVPNDFLTFDFPLDRFVFPFYVFFLALYFGKTIYQFATRRFFNLGKDIVVWTTALCWYLGIVAFNSDYAFTVTNVIIHGVPYFALIYFYARSRRENSGVIYRRASSNLIFFLMTLWFLAYVEEVFWHRGVWHEREQIFGAEWNLDEWKMYLVPLLAVPQLTHYLLDGFIWRRKYNPNFKLI